MTISNIFNYVQELRISASKVDTLLGDFEVGTKILSRMNLERLQRYGESFKNTLAELDSLKSNIDYELGREEAE